MLDWVLVVHYLPHSATLHAHHTTHLRLGLTQAMGGSGRQPQPLHRGVPPALPPAGQRQQDAVRIRASVILLLDPAIQKCEIWLLSAYTESTCLCLGDLEWDTKIDPFLTLFLLLVSGLERNSLFSSLSRLRSILLSAYCLSIFAFLASVGVATNIVSLKIGVK